MAFDFSKLNFFSRLDARARVVVLFGGIIGVIFLIYIGSRYLSSDAAAIGPSRVASAPKGLQSVPGGELTAEYSKALQQANTQAAQQAQMTGASAVPTLMNYGGQPQASGAATGNCTNICSDDAANVKYDLDEWVKQGKVSPEVATALQQLANKNVTVSEYAAYLDQMVKEGKLTPDQARQLLQQYKKQNVNTLTEESAQAMDDLIKSGKLTTEVANELLALQKEKVSPSDYAAKLQELVKQGKISPEVARQLLAQYSQQHAKGVIAQSIAILHQMARDGQIIPEIEKELVELETKMVPLSQYEAKLKSYVAAGKLIPAVSDKILEEYKFQKASIGPSGSVDQMLKQAEAEAFGELNDLVRDGLMTPEVAQQLSDRIQKSIPLDTYIAFVNQLVEQGKLTPEISKLKIADYKKVKGLRDMSAALGDLQANNASASAYTDQLKRQVQLGVITPEQAAQLLQEYQAATSRVPTKVSTTGSTTAFAELQQRVAQGAAQSQPTTTTEEFSEARTELASQNAQDQQAQVDAIMGAMQSQASQLVSSWQPNPMAHKAGSPDKETKSGTDKDKDSGTDSDKDKSASSTAAGGSNGNPLIKAGTVIFAVLDTTANSDYPDSPVMATVVDGKYKGAKLMGKLVTTKGISGQLDRISLNFTLMNVEEWPKSKSITAYGIDPDTARTVIASHVDYHYMQRFGAMMATSFMQGYASAITQAGTSTTGIFGTSTTHPELSPSQKIATALGQMGQAVGAATANYINIPPTVKVDAGVGLGILFMSDLT